MYNNLFYFSNLYTHWTYRKLVHCTKIQTKYLLVR